MFSREFRLNVSKQTFTGLHAVLAHNSDHTKPLFLECVVTFRAPAPRNASSPAEHAPVVWSLKLH